MPRGILYLFPRFFLGGRYKNTPNISERSNFPHSRWINPLETPKSLLLHLRNSSGKAGNSYQLLGVPPSPAPFSLYLQIPFVHLDLPLDCPLYSKLGGIQGKVLSDKNGELAPRDLFLEAESLLGRKAGGDFRGNLHLETPTFGQQIFLESGVWVWKSCGVLIGKKLEKTPPNSKIPDFIGFPARWKERIFSCVFLLFSRIIRGSGKRFLQTCRKSHGSSFPGSFP